MRRLCGGDSAAFDDLAGRYRTALLRFARSRLSDAFVAEDTVQETFFAVFRSRETFDDRYAFRTWLWTIHLNQIRRSASKAAKRPPHAGEPLQAAGGAELAEALSSEPGPHAQALANERAARLESWLRRLPDAQADALRLRFFGGLKYHEIASAMGCSLNAAKKRVRVGLLRLSGWMRDAAPLDPAEPTNQSESGDNGRREIQTAPRQRGRTGR